MAKKEEETRRGDEMRCEGNKERTRKEVESRNKERKAEETEENKLGEKSRGEEA